jgi:hypothetical protein
MRRPRAALGLGDGWYAWRPRSRSGHRCGRCRSCSARHVRRVSPLKINPVLIAPLPPCRYARRATTCPPAAAARHACCARRARPPRVAADARPMPFYSGSCPRGSECCRLCARAAPGVVGKPGASCGRRICRAARGRVCSGKTRSCRRRTCHSPRSDRVTLSVAEVGGTRARRHGPRHISLPIVCLELIPQLLIWTCWHHNMPHLSTTDHVLATNHPG